MLSKAHLWLLLRWCPVLTTYLIDKLNVLYWNTLTPLAKQLYYSIRYLMYFNKVSSYSHHMSPRLSGDSVHNISSFGKVLCLTQCVPGDSIMSSDGHSIEYLALSMVTALPPFITCTGSRVFWCRLSESNWPHPPYKSGALPNELNRQIDYTLLILLYTVCKGDCGGGDKDRTCDIQLAKLALSQLSYTPKYLAPPPGLEPGTKWLTVIYSTDWAKAE